MLSANHTSKCYNNLVSLLLINADSYQCSWELDVIRALRCSLASNRLAEFIAAGEIQELFLEISHVPSIYTSMLQAGENTILTILHLGEQLKALDSKCFQFVMDNLMEKKKVFKVYNKFALL